MLDKRTLAPAGSMEPPGECQPVRNAPLLTASGKPPDGEERDIQETLPRYCVLVIDHSLTMRTIIKTCLARAGFRVFAFPNGVEALRWLDSPQASAPGLILLDTDVPRIEWYTLVQILRKRPACIHAVLVILSRRDGLVDRIKARLAGAQSYIVKPFRTQELVCIVQRYLQLPASAVAGQKSEGR
jgi:twitching motility two-component system response regulator PilG